MNVRAWENPWRWMLAANVVVLIGVFLHKVSLPPFLPYTHLVVDYHFGFTKRALIGAGVSLFFSKVPVWLVFALGGGVWIITLGLFIWLFLRTFGRDDKHLPLFVFMAGSPFFLKNFMHTLGHFDIYGCAVAIGLLLAPAGSLGFVVAAGLASMILILIHHIHLLMYVPTIAVIVVLRHYLVTGMTRSNVVVGVAAMAGVGLLFLAAQFYGSLPVPKEEFIRHLETRLVDPTRTNLVDFAGIWYRPLSQEFHDTWDRMPSNILGVPVFALLIWLHAPLWRYFASLIRSLAEEAHRRIVTASIAAVSLAYLVMFVVVFDYSRWISNWAVCMFLILHAVKTLPAAQSAPPIPAKDRRTGIFGWAITLIPRVGIVSPI